MSWFFGQLSGHQSADKSSDQLKFDLLPPSGPVPNAAMQAKRVPPPAPPAARPPTVRERRRQQAVSTVPADALLLEQILRRPPQPPSPAPALPDAPVQPPVPPPEDPRLAELAARCASLERQCAVVKEERDRASREREDGLRALQAELEASRLTISSLETQQRQSREHAGELEPELQRVRDQVREALAAAEEEKRLRAQDTVRIAALERELTEQSASHMAEREEAMGPLRARCADLEAQLAEATRAGEHAAKSANLALEERDAEIAALRKKGRQAEGGETQVGEHLRRTQARLKEVEEALERERQLRVDADARLVRHRRDLTAAAGGAGDRGIERRRLFVRTACVSALVLAVACGVSFMAGRSAKQPPAVPSIVTPAPAPAVEAPPIAKVAPIEALSPWVAPTPPPEPSPVPAPRLSPAPEPSPAPVSSPEALPAKAAPPEWPAIQVAGTTIRSTKEDLTIVFESGVFSRYAEISPQARETLQTLAVRIKPSLDRLRLEIEGHTDSEPMRANSLYADNEALGQARADAVLAFLRQEAGLPDSAMEAVSAGADRPPHPDDTAESRRKNRTVVLRLYLPSGR